MKALTFAPVHENTGAKFGTWMSRFLRTYVF